MPEPFSMKALLLTRAIADLFWSFFPIFIIASVLFYLGRFDHIAERSDLTLCAAVFFAEGWWRVRKIPAPRAVRLEVFGFIGAVAAVLLASLVLFVELELFSTLVPLVTSRIYVAAQVTMLFLSIGYALAIRMKIIGRTDSGKAVEKAPSGV
jgi:uncharacterized protein YacL